MAQTQVVFYNLLLQETRQNLQTAILHLEVVGAI